MENSRRYDSSKRETRARPDKIHSISNSFLIEMRDVADLLNEQRGDSLQILFHESRSHPKTFPGKRQRNKRTIERRGFRFSHRDSVNITLAYLDWLSSSVIDMFPVNAQRYRNKRILYL